MLTLSMVFIFFAAGCGRKQPESTELRRYPLDGIADVITQTGVEFDSSATSDGKGSLKIVAAGPVNIPLFETGDINVEDAVIVYQAMVRTEGVEGKVYLEMWSSFGTKGEYFSRGLDAAITGSKDWTALKTPFFLRAGENPDNVKLNLVIDGKGTVWIDDIRLLKERM
ncbi:MAG: hypothetical protein A3J24_01835 [Deltaproteobacteria bacterium RIFCSPLOWO2_02_FULL_53_8]|nr:MAG: hypothetical protein A3J24_01835 [Deltaproteobacteria bacterium RIFCSPLOWO2_02_FULL_53_8]